MANIQAISKAEFTKKSWKRYPDYSFASKDTVCPLGASELPRAMMGMPLAFVAADGEYSVVAVQGLHEGANFFVDADGRWLDRYVPAAYRGYPFVLAENPSKKAELILCFNTDSGLLVDDVSGEPFFDDDLEVSKSVSQTFELLSGLNASLEASTRCCKILSGHGLLKPWKLEYETGKGTRQTDGLFCVDEAALRDLSGDAYAELRETGAIHMVYCQLLSMQRISDLTTVARLKSEVEAQRQCNELDFDGLNADGNISFDNL